MSRDLNKQPLYRKPRHPKDRNPQSHKQWVTIVGEPDHCVNCDRTADVTRWKEFANVPICKNCKKGMMEGTIHPFRLARDEKPVEPLDTEKTVRSKDAKLSRELANARWIKCRCGAEFKKNPFRSEDPPAFTKFVEHARFPGDEHQAEDWSDRDPNGDAAMESRLEAKIQWLEAEIEKLKKGKK